MVLIAPVPGRCLYFTVKHMKLVKKVGRHTVFSLLFEYTLDNSFVVFHIVAFPEPYSYYFLGTQEGNNSNSLSRNVS